MVTQRWTQDWRHVYTKDAFAFSEMGVVMLLTLNHTSMHTLVHRLAVGFTTMTQNSNDPDWEDRRTNKRTERQHGNFAAFASDLLKSFKPFFSVTDYNHGNKENQFGKSRKSVTAA